MKAPFGRGFSYIEIWLVGVQIPIILAIVEYAILLTMKRMYKNKISQVKVQVIYRGNQTQIGKKTIWDLDQIGKTVDKWSFISSLSFMIIFTIVYWSIAST
jgi:hypothetical protein